MMIFILGDWYFTPDDFPIDLLQGGQVNRPLSNITFTSPQGEVQTDWILCSKALLPACGIEEATEKMPDHWAIKLEFNLEFVSQGYMGQRSYETAERTDPLVIAVEYRKQRAQHLARWSTALMSHDQAGKVKATGKYNFAYMRTQDCRQLKVKRVKKRPASFATETETASSSGVPPAGEATGGLFPWASAVLPVATGTQEKWSQGKPVPLALWCQGEPAPQEPPTTTHFSPFSSDLLVRLTK
eukprot:5621015-Amphidinium_carterae.1